MSEQDLDGAEIGFALQQIRCVTVPKRVGRNMLGSAGRRFHNYSFGNILEIARQQPDATRVAGLYAWNQLGRKVKKGEKGIRILAPMIGTKRKKDRDAEKDITKQNQPVLVGFRAVYVFDVSQTGGAELPDLKERVKGEVGQYRERLIDFTITQGIELEFKESIAPALGMSYGGKIAIFPGQAPAEEFRTLVNELAHEMLHKAERRTATTQDGAGDRGRGHRLRCEPDHRPSRRTRIRRLHPSVSRQRGTPHREFGSDSAYRSPDLSAIENPAEAEQAEEPERALAKAS